MPLKSATAERVARALHERWTTLFVQRNQFDFAQALSKAEVIVISQKLLIFSDTSTGIKVTCDGELLFVKQR